MSPVAGFVRLRKHQFGRQAVFGTPVAATRAYPFKGVPSVNLNWTDPDVDTGSIVPTVAPQRGLPDITAPLTAPQLDYNSLPLLLSGLFGGGVAPTGGGTAQTWVYEPSSVAPLDDADGMTYEFGDDVTTDWFQLSDGYLTSLTITGPDGLGACTMSSSWKFGSAASTGSTDFPVTGTVPTPGLDVETTPALIYLKDMGIYIASSVAGLGAGQITDALHNFTLTFTAEKDEKRWANADQSFDVDAIANTGFAIELNAQYAKTSDIVGTGSEADAWMSDTAVDRYIELKFTSLDVAQTPSTFYSWDTVIPMRYYTREDTEVGGNTTVNLTAHAWYDPSDANDFFKSTIVNTLTEADLGMAGS